MQLTPEIQHEIQNLLEEIWSVFRRAGTTEQREIVASLAALLTNGKAEAFEEELRPRKPRNRYNVDDELIPLLNRVSEKIDMGTFFDRYILFYGQLKEGDNAYATPRHIIDFMTKLLQIEQIKPTDSFADFTCGTGGFLVNRYRQDNLRQGDTVGIEISPDWIRLAVANAILHDITIKHAHFKAGNALRICSEDPKLKSRQFDRIAMAPPFGGKVEDELAGRWANGSSGRANEDLFTRLALKKLRPDGWAVLLVPVGLTYKETRGMRLLRGSLLQDYTLHAVISLPENTLAPFAPNPVCVLLIHNQPSDETQQIWLFKAQKDGYTAGLNRDLLTDPKSTPDSNDLPLAEKAILLQDTTLRPITTAKPQIDTGISFTYVVSENDIATQEQQPHGMLIKVGENTILHSIRLLSITQANVQQTHLLIETSRESQELHYTVLSLSINSQGANAFHIFVDRAELNEHLRHLYGQANAAELPKGLRIYQDGFPGQKIVISQDGRLLGITQLRSSIKAPDYWLQPERYIPLPEVTFSTDSPVKLLSKLQQDQHLIARYVDNLLGQLEAKPIAGKELPAPLYDGLNSSLIQALGPEQREIWKFIEQQTLTEQQVGGEKRYALYFMPHQLYNDQKLSNKNELHIQQTLDLLVRIGLLTRVLVKLPERESPLLCYRRITVLDIAEFPERLDA